MNEQSPLSVASKLTAVSLVAGTAGIVIQILTGVEEYPMIPPGAVILLAAALLVSLLRWQWAPVVGVALAILILVGAFVTPGTGIVYPNRGRSVHSSARRSRCWA